jgi:hypothetical protein
LINKEYESPFIPSVFKKIKKENIIYIFKKKKKPNEDHFHSNIDRKDSD